MLIKSLVFINCSPISVNKAIFLSENCNFWQPNWICRPPGVWWHISTKIPKFWSCATLCPRPEHDWIFFATSVYIKLGRGKQVYWFKTSDNVRGLYFSVVESQLGSNTKSIKHVSSTIYLLDLAGNCITTLKNMENIVFRNLTRICLMGNRIYAVNWCVSRWNGRDTMDVIIFFISRPGGLAREKV